MNDEWNTADTIGTVLVIAIIVIYASINYIASLICA